MLCVACSASLPTPPLIMQPRSEFLPVPYPPPAAFAETVPEKPAASAVWVDGYWAWRGKLYVWQRGGWVVPPLGARYAPWRLHYSKDGTLLFAEATWYDAKGHLMESPTMARSAFTPPNELTPETQHGF